METVRPSLGRLSDHVGSGIPAERNHGSAFHEYGCDRQGDRFDTASLTAPSDLASLPIVPSANLGETSISGPSCPQLRAVRSTSAARTIPRHRTSINTVMENRSAVDDTIDCGQPFWQLTQPRCSATASANANHFSRAFPGLVFALVSMLLPNMASKVTSEGHINQFVAQAAHLSRMMGVDQSAAALPPWPVLKDVPEPTHRR